MKYDAVLFLYLDRVVTVVVNHVCCCNMICKTLEIDSGLSFGKKQVQAVLLLLGGCDIPTAVPTVELPFDKKVFYTNAVTRTT